MSVDRPATVRQVALEDIGAAGDGPFCMSFGFDPLVLARSIEAAGVVNRPLLRQEEGGFTVVAGFRRIQALRLLGRSSVSCTVVQASDMSVLEGVRTNLFDNLSTRSFNEVEKAMVLGRLSGLVSRKDLLDTYMPLLSLARRDVSLSFYLMFDSEAEPNVKEALARGDTSVKLVKTLMDIDPASRTALFDAALDLKLNINQQIQFVELISDISHDEKVPPHRVLEMPALKRTATDTSLNAPQKAKAVLALLRATRFPRLTGAEERFRKTVASFRLPDRVRIEHPPFFEGPYYRLEVLFGDGTELAQKLELLRGVRLDELTGPWGDDDR